MSSTSPPQSLYVPANQAYPAPYRYEDPTGPHSPLDDSGDISHQSPIAIAQSATATTTTSISPATPATTTTSKPQTESKPRLRKACDSCSVRKVKCDESGPPCRSCAALDIPCTFNRPSRRRGPPNRHAEAIKRQKLEDGSYNLFAASPTRDAAYSLAALSAPMPLSAESICDVATLDILIDDYFTYIHPLIPFPHEPTFRAAFARREDKTDRSFLALLASMIETLVASFPRRPRQLFTSDLVKQQYPNAGALIDRCHQTFCDARGSGFLDGDLNLNDAAGSYLAAVAAAYVFDMNRFRLYIGEAVMILRTLGFHQTGEVYRPTDEFGQTSAPEIDYIEQQSGRRLFWLLFVGAMSVRQLGSFDADIIMPPMSHAESLPPMPVEVDDEFITSGAILNQPAGSVSMLTGFNINARIFRAFHNLTALEMAFGADTVFDWDRQRQMIKRALNNVKNVTQDVPPELRLSESSEYGEWPPKQPDISAYNHLLNGRRDPPADTVGLHSADEPRRASLPLPYPKRAIQFEIQKANIYATQLATRSHLVEKFWNLYEIHDREGRPTSAGFAFDQKPITSSPTASLITAGIDNRYQQTPGRTPSDSLVDSGEQYMAVEREDIVRDMATLLKSINQVNMEPNGLSFCHKIRQVASTLLNQDRGRMAVMPTLDTQSVNEYLYGFCDILQKLERLGPSRLRGNDGREGQPKTLEEVEDEELVHWASLRDYQERFTRSEGFMTMV